MFYSILENFPDDRKGTTRVFFVSGGGSHIFQQIVTSKYYT